MESNFPAQKKSYDVALQEQHIHTIWTRYATILLGVWLLLSPVTFGYAHVNQMLYSDLASGFLMIIGSMAALNVQKRWGPWLVAGVSFWLQFAPLILWAPDAATYVNDTLVAALALLFAIIIPGLPGVVEQEGPDMPPGWTYNPSAWVQRLPVIALACVAWFLARYMAAYQLGYITSIWDPFFGEGTRLVITSDLSKAFPVADTGMGAMAYSLETLLGCKGGTRRWCTMPWIVLIFGILVVPVGVISILLVICQPLVVGAWCGICLLTACCMLVMVGLAVDEMVAVVQFLSQVRKEGRPVWEIFWKGGDATGSTYDTRSPVLGTNSGKEISGMFWGMTPTWSLMLSTFCGVWMLVTPTYYGVQGNAANIDYMLGALIVAISIISMAEVVRAARFSNILLGLFVAASSWLLVGGTQASMINNLCIGALLIILSIPRGTVKENYGTWDHYIR